MLSLKFIQENKETVIERLAIKNFDAREPIDKIIALDNLRKSLQQEAESKQAEMNRIAKEIGKLMQTGQKEEAEKARQETSQLKNDIAELSNRRNEVSNQLTDLLLRIPNLPHASVPKGKSDADVSLRALLHVEGTRRCQVIGDSDEIGIQCLEVVYMETVEGYTC